MNKKVAFPVLAISSILIGIYPLLYFITDMNSGLLENKSVLLLRKGIWNIAFYTHISLGGLALAIGWSQFSRKLRKNNIELHRDIGRVYMICVLFSGIASLYLAIYATGGLISTFGFFALGMFWMVTTLAAFIQIKNGKVKKHQKLMTYSFAACFAAVTLRIWLPVLSVFIENEIIAFQMVAWLCWIPNIVVAYFLIKNKGQNRKKRKMVKTN